MELPVAKQSYLPSSEALVRAVKHADVALAHTAAEPSALEGATAFTSAARPRVRSANFATELHVPDGWSADAVLDGVGEHFERAGAPCHALDSADAVWPDELAGAAERRSYLARRKLVFLLQEYAEPAQRDTPLQIIPARAAYAELRPFYRDMAVQQHGFGEATADELAETMFEWLDEPRLDLFLGRVDGRPVGVAGVLGLGQIGVINPAYTGPAHRGKGIGAALLAATIEHCQRASFDQVLLSRSDGCPSIPLYERLGFARVAEYTRYVPDYRD